jgi:hypothetical protein
MEDLTRRAALQSIAAAAAAAAMTCVSSSASESQSLGNGKCLVPGCSCTRFQGTGATCKNAECNHANGKHKYVF